MTIPLYVLVGGRSERFGTAKATHPVDGQPWARHVASRLAEDRSQVAIVGKSKISALPDLRFVADWLGVEGPLAGAMAAVEDRRQRYGPGCLVLASCDLVRPQPSWLQPLLAAFETSAANEALLEAAAYRVDGLWQPFPMVVHTRWHDRLRDHVDSGKRLSFQAVLDESGALAVPWTEPPASGPPQANTPEALRALLDD